LIDHGLQVIQPGRRSRPSGVEGNVRDRGRELFLRQSILERLLEMELDLLDTVQRDQAGHRDQAFVPLR
jgi:hypothetical protein